MKKATYSTNLESKNSIKGNDTGEVTMLNKGYEVYMGEDGVCRARRYNQKTKMWLTIKFIGDDLQNMPEEITEVLKNQYIERIIHKI